MQFEPLLVAEVPSPRARFPLLPLRIVEKGGERREMLFAPKKGKGKEEEEGEIPLKLCGEALLLLVLEG